MNDLKNIFLNGGCKSGRGINVNRVMRHEVKRDPENADMIRSLKLTHHLRHQYQRSGFNYNALKRWLRAQVGRKWDDVYSELSKAYPKNSSKTDPTMFWNSVKYEVYTKTRMDPVHGVLVSGSGGEHRPESGLYRQDRYNLYVHPETGILCIAQYKKSKHNRDFYNNEKYMDPLNHLIQYHKIGDSWYEIHLREATELEKKHQTFDKVYEYRWLDYDPLIAKHTRARSAVKVTPTRIPPEIMELAQSYSWLCYGPKSKNPAWNFYFYAFGDYRFPIYVEKINKKRVARIKSMCYRF